MAPRYGYDHGNRNPEPSAHRAETPNLIEKKCDICKKFVKVDTNTQPEDTCPKCGCLF